MKRLFSGKSYFEELLARTNAGYELILSTYNLPTHEDHAGFINQLLSKGVRAVYVGIPNTTDTMFRVYQMASRFPQITWRFSLDWHAKYCLAYRGRTVLGWVGSHNLSVNGMCDMSVRLTPDQTRALREEHCKRTTNHFGLARLKWKIENRAPVDLTFFNTPTVY